VRELIVNADDFGISEGVNRGIIKSFQDGIVSDTSLMTNLPAFDSAVSLAHHEPRLNVGIHLNLTCGKALSAPHLVSSLVNKDGSFYSRRKFLQKLFLDRVSYSEIAMEFTEQVEKVIRSGLKPSHLDTHHHLHFYPAINKIVISIAQKYQIKRVRGSSTPFYKSFYWRGSMLFKPATYSGLLKLFALSNLGNKSRKTSTGNHLSTKEVLGMGYIPSGDYQKALSFFLKKVPVGVSELVCHPGYVDDELKSFDKWVSMREEELNGLTSPETHSLIKDLDLHLAPSVI